MSRLHFLERLRVDALNVMISGRGHLDGFIRVGLFLSRRYIQCPALIPAVGLFLRIGSFLVVLFLWKYRYLDLSRLNLVSICFAAIFSLPRVLYW